MKQLLPQYSRWLANPPQRQGFRNEQELAEVSRQWGSAGADIITLGQSSQGRDILAAAIGQGSKTMLAWGFPHPDEPLGSEALVWLGESLLGKSLTLEDWRVVIVLCPDPDQVSRQLWLAGPLTALDFVSGCWRPEHLGREVDYGFPLDHQEFYWPADAVGSPRPDEDGYKTATPFSPLPESLALAAAIERFRPNLVFSMHSTHSGGDYTFLLQEEDRELLHAIKQMPEACGLWRHLGEPIDKGQPWLEDSPDLIREQNLDWFRRGLRSHSWFDEDLCYGGNHSAAAFIESILPDSQFICPESTLFRSPLFADLNRLEERLPWRQEVTADNRGRRWVEQSVYFDNHWEEVHRFAAGAADRRGEFRAPLSRGALGVLAVKKRREQLSKADKIWLSTATAVAESGHPYLYEKELMPAPGDIDEDQLRKFKLSKAYRQPATRADWASFNGVWPIHTAAMLGGFSGLLQEAEATKQLEKLHSLQKEILTTIPPEMSQAGPIAPALQSMIGRVLLASQSERHSAA